MANKYLVDTNSLLTLVRYYLCFDNDEILYNKIQDAFKSSQCLLLENVKKEAEFTAQGIILEELDFLEDEEKIIVQESVVPTKKLDRIIDDNWCLSSQRKEISEEKYSERKRTEIEDKADFQLILTAIKMRRKGILCNKKPIIVTEESRKQDKNDGKLFKKIPLIADSEKIDCINLTELLTQLGVEIQYTTK